MKALGISYGLSVLAGEGPSHGRDDELSPHTQDTVKGNRAPVGACRPRS